ncbi:MAG: hypothetical protein L3J21_07665 [Devosiaceae bacterium]|nr:hypothetical protein [Devosiaceae bacterium]
MGYDAAPWDMMLHQGYDAAPRECHNPLEIPPSHQLPAFTPLFDLVTCDSAAALSANISGAADKAVGSIVAN